MSEHISKLAIPGGMTELFEETLKFMGLDKFRCELVRTPHDRYKLQLRLAIEVMIDPETMVQFNPKEFIETSIDPIFHDVRNSRLVKLEQGKLKEYVEQLSADLRKAQNENKELVQFKAYYELAHKMQHGK